jgi:hypothetical protein
MDAIVGICEEGLAAGEVTPYRPRIPQMATDELSESELERLADGADHCGCCSSRRTCT